jgi:hypothetical protein
MELKVVCNCGQKYIFNVEPENGRMPVKVACPSCGADGTASADEALAGLFPDSEPPIPVAAAIPAQPKSVTPPAPPPLGAPAGLRINRATPAPAEPGPQLAITGAPRTVAPLRPGASPAVGANPKTGASYSLGLGVLGAFLGAAVGAGLMYGFFALTEFRFPLMGTCIGVLTGLGARLLARGTEMTLGAIAGAIALLATGGVLYFMFGDVAATFIVSMIVSVAFAYKIAG